MKWAAWRCIIPVRIKQALGRKWPLLGVLFLATFLRLYALDLIDVRYDEASAPQLAYGIARGQLLALAPFSGSVANHPPLFLYLLSLPYLFTRDLLMVAAYRAMLDVIAIALLGWLCVRYFNRRVATVATLLFAVAPWAIQYSRKLSIVTPALFIVILLFGLLEALRRHNPTGWTIAGLGLALCIGSHLTAIYLVPVYALAIFLGWRSLKPLPVILGLLPVCLVAALYLAADASHGFANVQSIMTAMHQGGTVNFDSLNMAFWASGGSHLSDLTDGAFSIWQSQIPAPLNLVDSMQEGLLAVGVISLIGIMVHHFRHSRWRRASVDALLLVWWCVPIVLQLHHDKPLQMHYLIILYPIPFLIMAVLVDEVIRIFRYNTLGSQVLKGLVSVVLLLVVVWQVFTTIRFDDFVSRYNTSTGGYGPPIRSALDVAQMAREQVCTTNCDDGIIIVTPGGDPRVDEWATVFDVILAGVPHRFDNATTGLILRTDSVRYIFTPGSGRAMAELFSHVSAQSVISHSISVRTGSSSAYTYIYINQPKVTGFQPTPQATFTNGIALVGYSTHVGDALTLHVLLHVSHPVRPGTDYHWFSHILVNGQKIAQLDDGGIQPSNWHAGDLLLHWFDIPLPSPVPSRLTALIGCYTYPGLLPVQATLPDGQIVNAITLGIH